MQPGPLFFVGMPDRWEQMLLSTLHEQYTVQMLENATVVYQHIALTMPSILFFSTTQRNTATLRLFRQLRRLEHLCVVVCHTQTMQVFLGKGYPHRCWLPKNPTGMYSLLNWIVQIQSLTDGNGQTRLILPAPTIPSKSSSSPGQGLTASLQGLLSRTTSRVQTVLAGARGESRYQLSTMKKR